MVNPVDCAVGAARLRVRRALDELDEVSRVSDSAYVATGSSVDAEQSDRTWRSVADLAVEWFIGWVAAACEQQIELTVETDGYVRRRLAEARAGRLAVTVDHADLLVLPSASPR